MPSLWLLSDPVRLPDPRQAMRRLPRGAVVLLRDAAPGIALAVARCCRRLGLRLIVSGDGRLALALGAGLHVPDRRPTRFLCAFLLGRRGRLLSVAVHGRRGIARARALRASAALVSPAFPTPSHPGQRGLGPWRWAALACALPCPAIALGGMSAARVRHLPPRWRAGWAGIGALVLSGTQCVSDVGWAPPSRLPGAAT
ncbi:MAG TPA: thiamine phosphate synthase [Roseococcus sp.]|nr:thiamine phosphate synthase [Roseococcus sp.]